MATYRIEQLNEEGQWVLASTSAIQLYKSLLPVIKKSLREGDFYTWDSEEVNGMKVFYTSLVIRLVQES